MKYRKKGKKKQLKKLKVEDILKNKNDNEPSELDLDLYNKGLLPNNFNMLRVLDEYMIGHKGFFAGYGMCAFLYWLIKYNKKGNRYD